MQPGCKDKRRETVELSAATSVASAVFESDLTEGYPHFVEQDCELRAQ